MGHSGHGFWCYCVQQGSHEKLCTNLVVSTVAGNLEDIIATVYILINKACTLPKPPRCQLSPCIKDCRSWIRLHRITRQLNWALVTP